jgi:hypothetical protein
MNIDEFLDKETSHLSGKTNLIDSSEISSKKEDEQDLFKQIQSVRDQISQKKIGSANKEFSSLRERYVDMTKKQMQQSQFLFDELIKINSELISNIEQQSQEALKKVNLIKLLIANAKESLNKNLIDDANKIYNEIKQIYNQIPELFYEEKRKINEEILSFYILLSRYNETLLIQLFMRKKSEIKNLMSNAKVHLKSGNAELIKNDFDQISEAYSQLPDGFAHDKAVIYMDILKLFSSAYLSNHSLALSSEIALSESALLNRQAEQVSMSSIEPISGKMGANTYGSYQSANLFSADQNNAGSSQPSYNSANQSQFAGLLGIEGSGDSTNNRSNNLGFNQSQIPTEQRPILHSGSVNSEINNNDDKKKGFFSGIFGKKDKDSQLKPKQGTAAVGNKKK